MLVQKKEKTELQAQIDLSMHVQVYERKREREHLYLSGTYRCLASHDLSYLRKGILNILLGGKKTTFFESIDIDVLYIYI